MLGHGDQVLIPGSKKMANVNPSNFSVSGFMALACHSPTRP